jgi:hypothetical protein
MLRRAAIPLPRSHRYQQALAICRGEAAALNGLGEALTSIGVPTDALSRHTAALTVAVETGIGTSKPVPIPALPIRRR